jgi:hypothetical protein
VNPKLKIDSIEIRKELGKMTKYFSIWIFCLIIVLANFSTAFAKNYIIRQISNNERNDIQPQININGDIVWVGVFLYDNAKDETIQLGVRLILRSKLGEMTVNKERPEMLPAIA